MELGPTQGELADQRRAPHTKRRARRDEQPAVRRVMASSTHKEENLARQP